MFKKISNRIIFSFMGLVTVLVALLLLLIMDHIREYHLNVIKREMAEKTDVVEFALRRNPAEYLNGPIVERQKQIRGIAGLVKLRITLIDGAGVVHADSEYGDPGGMDNHKYRPEVMTALARGDGYSIRHSNTINADMLYYARRSDFGTIRVARHLREVDESVSRLLSYVMAVGAGLLVIICLITIIIVRKITRPIQETMSFARDFADGDLTRRIQNYSNDEIGLLQRALNRLADTAQDRINGLMTEQQKLLTTIENIHDGIAVIGRDRKILVANAAFKMLLDVNMDVVDKLFFEVIRNRSMNSWIDRAHVTGEPASFSERLLNGRHCEIFITPVRGESALQGMVIVLHDTTEKKKIEQMKTDLVSNMSHELKTPVAILKGYLETLEQHLGDPVMTKDLLQKALNNVDRQGSLINDILKLNRLETSNDFPMESIDIQDCIRTCIEILSPRAQKKQVSIIYSNTGLNDRIEGNRFLAEEVFFNIIDNAINYNNEGGSISLGIKNFVGKTTVSIADTGVGIPEDSIDRIFERFYRVDKSRSRSTGGTGLGLSIVKHAVEILGWNIRVASGATGTEFVIEI